MERPFADNRPLAWRNIGPRLGALHTANRSALYGLPRKQALSPSADANDPPLEAIPYHSFGAFDHPESLSLLTRLPRNADLLGFATNAVSLSRLDMLSEELEPVAAYDGLSAGYGLGLWQADRRPNHNGIYLPQCVRNCGPLQRLEPGKAPLNYELPEWKSHNTFDSYPYWHYQLSPEGEFLVLASASQVAVFAVDQADEPLAVMDLPDRYAAYSLGSLSVGLHAETVMLGIYKQERFGVEFMAEILEVTRDGKGLILESGFAERARAEGSEVLGAFQTLSRDGQTLAVSEYRQVEYNRTDYTWLNTPVTVALGYPAISVWERNESSQWRLRQRIEWQDRRGSRKLRVSAPRQMEVITISPLGLSRISSESQIHQELQLSPDGRRLLSGLETDEENHELRATGYLFDIQGDAPVLLGDVTTTVADGGFNLQVAYPRLRLSESGNHAAMGWFLYHASRTRREQTLRVQVFTLPDPAPAVVDSPGGRPVSSNRP